MPSPTTTTMNGTTARPLVGQGVWVGGLRVGVVDDVVLGADLAIVLGVIVETTAERHCFLPWIVTCVRSDGSLDTSSTAMLLGETELDYYLRSGAKLSRVLGLALDDADAVVNDILIGRGGRIEGFLLSDGDRKRAIPLADTRVRWSEGRLLELSIGGLEDTTRHTRSMRSAA